MGKKKTVRAKGTARARIHLIRSKSNHFIHCSKCGRAIARSSDPFGERMKKARNHKKRCKSNGKPIINFKDTKRKPHKINLTFRVKPKEMNEDVE